MGDGLFQGFGVVERLADDEVLELARSGDGGEIKCTMKPRGAGEVEFACQSLAVEIGIAALLFEPFPEVGGTVPRVRARRGLTRRRGDAEKTTFRGRGYGNRGGAERADEGDVF